VFYRRGHGRPEWLALEIELASPADFIPEVPGWQDRSLAIERRGKVAYCHYDLYAQALAKIERGHAQDDPPTCHRSGQAHAAF
jgi:hypothetical protein